MLNHRHEQIEPQSRSSRHHLRLHGAAPFESGPTADDQREVVCTQIGVAGRCVIVGKACGVQDRAGVHAGVEALLLQRQALEMRQAVAVGGALVWGISWVED